MSLVLPLHLRLYAIMAACVAASCMVCFAVLMYYFVSAAAATAAAGDHGNDTVGIGLGA